MAGNRKIRITQNDRREYARLVKNTKAKIARTRKAHNGHDISDQITIPSIQEFTNRKSFNRKKEEMRQFTDRKNKRFQFVTNDNGVTVNKMKLEQVKKDSETARKQAQEKVDKVKDNPFYSGGKQTESTVGQVSQQLMRPAIAGIIVPEPFDFNKITSVGQLEKTGKRAENRARKDYYDKRNEKMRDNYMKVIDATFHDYGEKLKAELNKLKPDDFFELYGMVKEFAFTLYDSDSDAQDDEISEQRQGEADMLLAYVKMYRSGELNSDLKNFDKPPQ